MGGSGQIRRESFSYLYSGIGGDDAAGVGSGTHRRHRMRKRLEPVGIPLVHEGEDVNNAAKRNRPLEF
jgi:hypothetical protein